MPEKAGAFYTKVLILSGSYDSDYTGNFPRGIWLYIHQTCHFRCIVVENLAEKVKLFLKNLLVFPKSVIILNEDAIRSKII